MKKSAVASFQRALLDWYDNNHRSLPWRATSDPYRIWVSEVMLQQTQVGTVQSYYRRFVERFPSVFSLAHADLQEVLKYWEGLGYYARARNLHRAAGEIVRSHGGRIPASPEKFKQLPGVGDYICAAVLSIAFNRDLATVDGNVKRVLARLFEIDAPVNRSTFHRRFESSARMLLETSQPGIFNQAMMELGALVCTPSRPRCSSCPVIDFCQAFRNESVKGFPKRRKNEKSPHHLQVAGVVRKNGRMLITRRAENGLLGGLWEFPSGPLTEKENAAAACEKMLETVAGLKIRPESRLTCVKHAYTHFKISLEVFWCRYLSGEVALNGPVDFRWVTIDELDRYPFHKANTKFFNLL